MRRAWVSGFVVLVAAMLLGGCGDLRGLLAADPSSQPAPVPAPEPQAAAAAPTTSQVNASATVTPAPTETPVTPSPTSATPGPSPSATETAPSEPSPPPSDGLSGRERIETEAVELTNAERAAAGCPDVHVDDRLVEAARGHSEDMVERGFFDHTNPDGDDPWDRANAAGYDWLASENIAWGYRTAEDVVAGWMNSDGHRRNILDCDVVAVGVGVADPSGNPYWTQMFGRR